MQNPADFDRPNHDTYGNMPNEPGRMYYDEYTGREYYVPYPQEQANTYPNTPPKNGNKWFAPLIGVLGALVILLIVFLLIKFQGKKDDLAGNEYRAGRFSNIAPQQNEIPQAPENNARSNAALEITVRAMEVELTQQALAQTLTALNRPSETPTPTATMQRTCQPSRYRVNDSVWADADMTLFSTSSENASHIATVREDDILWIIGEPECVNGDNMLNVRTTHEKDGWVYETQNGNTKVSYLPTQYICSQALPSRFSNGMTGKVNELPADNNKVFYSYENTKDDGIKFKIAPGETFTVVDDPICYNGTVFIKIQDNSGRIGWTRESGAHAGPPAYYYLAPTR